MAKYTYNAWGAPLTIKDGTGNDVSGNPNHIANLNPFRYRGYFYDVETGYYYLNSRYYDPMLGRFISGDNTLADYNLFRYCNNNPVMYSDPSGHAPSAATFFLIGAGIVLGAAFLAGAVVGLGGISTMAAAIAIGATKGAAIGYLAGTAIGAGLGYAITGSGEAALKWAGAGSMIGALVGAYIGGWHGYASYMRSTVAINGQRAAVYRGGDSMTLKSNEYRILADGSKRGISVNIDPNQVQNFGGAYRVTNVPRGLQIVQQGRNLSHYEIIPKEALTSEKFQLLLNQIILRAVY